MSCSQKPPLTFEPICKKAIFVVYWVGILEDIKLNCVFNNKVIPTQYIIKTSFIKYLKKIAYVQDFNMNFYQNKIK